MSRTFNDIFMTETLLLYPPFSSGVLIEQYMNEFIKLKGTIGTRKYINVNWTNIFVNKTFKNQPIDEKLLQDYLDKLDPNEKYFTVVQLDDGVLFKLPPDTLVYGCCSNIPIPLVYDTNLFNNIPKKKFSEKRLFCSFVGSLTHPVREEMVKVLDEKKFSLIVKKWSPVVEQNYQNAFVNVTLDSRFILAPRGYGRNSFRFWEALEMNTIPVYIWDDVDFLPFKDKINYKQLCISMNVSDLSKLEEILNNISESDYNDMLSYYQEVKHLFTYEGICNYIIDQQ